MAERLRVGILGATGTVGQRFIQLLEGHPFFEVAWLAASDRSTGRRYEDAVRWKLDTPIPAAVRDRRPDGDYPVVWARQYGKGRVFNIGWGEFEETWDDPGVQGLILGAIRWAVGSVEADVTPRPMPKAGGTATK